MRRAFAGIVLLVLLTSSLTAATAAELRGVLKDRQGNPIANLAISLIRAELRQSLKSDHLGNFVFKNLVAGEYAVEIDNPNFKAIEGTKAKIKPGESTFLTVILQQVFDVDATRPVPRNDEIRTILRNTADGRLILRNNPNAPVGMPEMASALRGNGLVEFYSGSGWGSGDFTVFPVSPYAGMLTNFAYSEEVSPSLSYVFAGQFVSGDDSLWKVRNSMRYRLGKNQAVELLLGYSRLAFNSRNSVLVNDPSGFSQNPDFLNAVGSARILALGLKHSWNPTEDFSLAYGLEVDRLNASGSETFTSPALEAGWRPWAGGEILARVTSKRATRYNTLQLPNGVVGDVAEPLYLTKIGNTVRVGENRHHEVAGKQQWGSTRAELALFLDQLRGGNSFLVFTPEQNDGAVLDLPFRSTEQRGIRACVSTGSEILNYGIDYVYGTALGFDPPDRHATSVEGGLGTHHYHAVTGRVQTVVPRVHTVVTGLIRVVPGKPLTTVDLFRDTLNVSNQSVNLFVRQVIPFPDLLGFSPRLEALLDLRNVLNHDIGLLHTDMGDYLLVRNPRTVRGGISLVF
ncbi:MAG TPA: carboxypeptidase-like regulatory domain-containing protein [Acidobacteriota bacterium]|nr:carboxypeptidase-like regulatory domain-containing protein [Acidobacteriota bacterium]